MCACSSHSFRTEAAFRFQMYPGLAVNVEGEIIANDTIMRVYGNHFNLFGGENAVFKFIRTGVTQLFSWIYPLRFPKYFTITHLVMGDDR